MSSSDRLDRRGARRGGCSGRACRRSTPTRGAAARGPAPAPRAWAQSAAATLESMPPDTATIAPRLRRRRKTSSGSVAATSSSARPAVEPERVGRQRAVSLRHSSRRRRRACARRSRRSRRSSRGSRGARRRRGSGTRSVDSRCSISSSTPTESITPTSSSESLPARSAPLPPSGKLSVMNRRTSVSICCRLCHVSRTFEGAWTGLDGIGIADSALSRTVSGTSSYRWGDCVRNRGHLRPVGASRLAGTSPRHGGRAASSWSRRGGPLPRRQVRDVEHPARDRRPRGRRPAALERERALLGDAERRDLQLRRAAGRAPRARPSLRDLVGHGGPRARVRGVGGRLPAPVERRLRLRRLGPADAGALRRARPLRRAAALPRRARRRSRLRLRGEGAPAPSLGSP